MTDARSAVSDPPLTTETPIADAPVPVLLVDLATRRILDVSTELESVAGASRRQLVGTDATTYLIGGPSPALPLLVSGVIDGYEMTRRLRYPDEREVTVHVWAHAAEDARPPASAIFVIDEIDGAAVRGWTAPPVGGTVIGTVDPDWRISEVSNDVRAVLGYNSKDVEGSPLLGAVHPGDVGDLLSALGHARRSHETVMVRLRIRTHEGSWNWCRAWVAQTGASGAFTFILRPVASQHAGDDVVVQLRERLARILYEINVASALVTTAALPVPEGLPGLAGLTGREWEVVTALQQGIRGTDVARALNLAPSTVRNHLSSVYRKLGVSSQVELLAALNNRAAGGSQSVHA